MITICRVPGGPTISVDAAAVKVITVEIGTSKGEFELPPGTLTLPTEFLNTARTELKTWSEIQKEIADLRRNGKPVTALEAARDKLLADFGRIDVAVGVGAAGFLGIGSLDVAAGAQARAHLTLNLVNMEPAKGSPEDVVLRAELSASGQAANRTVAAHLEVRVTRQDVWAVPALTVERLNTLPAIDLRWPKLPFDTLDWKDLDLAGLSRLLRLDVPLPGKAPLIDVRLDSPSFQVTVTNGKLSLKTAKTDGRILLRGSGAPHELAAIKDFALDLSGGALAVAGKITASAGKDIDIAGDTYGETPRALPFTLDLAPAKLLVTATGAVDLAGSGNLKITATLSLPRAVIRAKQDRDLLLALKGKYQVTYDAGTGAVSGRLTELAVVEPYPVKLAVLAADTAADAAAALLRWVSGISVDASGPELKDVLKRIAAMVRAGLAWLAETAADAFGAVLGLAESLLELIGKLIEKIGKLLPTGSVNPHLVVELQLDARTYRLRRILISPATESAPVVTGDRTKLNAAGLDLSLPADAAFALLVDLDGPGSVALLAASKSGGDVTLATDLWLSGDRGDEAIRETDERGDRPSERLISVSAPCPTGGAIAVARWSGGRPSFLEEAYDPSGGAAPVLEWAAPDSVSRLRVARVGGALAYKTYDAGKLKVATNFAGLRRLPFLKSDGGSGGGPLDAVGQYIEISKGGDAAFDAGRYKVPLTATLKLGGTSVPVPLALELDPRTLGVSLAAGDEIPIESAEETEEFDLFGLKAVVKGPKGPNGKYRHFAIRLSGAPALSLAENARLTLRYGKVASEGGGLEFKADTLRLSSAGLDLDAEVDRDRPVTLAGVGMPFRFQRGALSIKQSRVQAFSIAGTGQLPPELVGEANATIAISMGRGKGGDLVVQSAEATLDKSGDPYVCNGTWFDLTLSAIGLAYKDFSDQDSGYHFYFTLSGSAEFRPRSNEAVSGLLKNLAGTKITLDKAPLARDPSLLLQSIEFQVPVEPPKRFNIFNLFSFELRGVGFHPASLAFGGRPAMSISGQVNFAEAGDAISPRFDFHKMWIGPAKAGDWVPQIRFDGLTVGVRFGGSANIEGTAYAVDDQLPSLIQPGALPADFTARGFLASGKLSIQGWASMGAAMGFLELRKGKTGPIRHAFFLAADLKELSYEIPTPVGNLYLRQVGFGFGLRYTLAAFNRADQVSNVPTLISTLDEISRYQGDLASIRSWEPEAEGDRVTLALSGVISIASASTQSEYNRDGETELSNPVLFDVVVALRSDLTFFLAARVFLCFNYEDYLKAPADGGWKTRPTLRGYTYLSVPRQEFLARLIADGEGEVGPHPQLPEPLVSAMKGVKWSATTYIRPGLFHQEFGWPYELQFTLKNGDRFRIDCSGGMIQRIEDGAMLFGIAFRAKGWAQIGGRVGGRSFGASVHARTDFSLDAKLIAYISVARRDDTLFYGSLAFDASIKLEVRVWIEFSVGFRDIRLEIGFSQSLTVSLALEVAATPSMIAGRGSASVGVSGFGRSLRLGIGVAFNEDELVKARARVERFLQLGLTVSTPDPAKAVEPPAPSPPRGRKSAEADDALERKAEKQGALKKPKPLPGVPPVEVEPKGDDLRPAAYWALIFRAGEDRYVMTFVPRDRTATGLSEALLPTRLADGKAFGGFYPPPSADGSPVLTVSMPAGAAVDVVRLESAGAETPFTFKNGEALAYEGGFVVAEGDQPLELSTFLSQCYIRRKSDNAYREPLSLDSRGDRDRLPQDREAAAQALMEAGRDQLDLEADLQKAVELEERRSAAIASIGDTAAALAAGGAPAWGVAAKGGVDVRAMGLAFVVSGAQLKALFPATAADDGRPREAAFGLQQTGLTAATTANVHLFNPPERLFDAQAPSFADPSTRRTPTGIALRWDLEPPFVASAGVWHDPEFRLKHYRIVRTIERRLEPLTLWDAVGVTSKSGAPATLVRDPVTGAYVWRFTHFEAQYVDELADLPAAARDAILGLNVELPADGAARDIVIAARENDLVVRYSVTPVDIAGAEGIPLGLPFFVQPPVAQRVPLQKAEIAFKYDQLEPIRTPDSAVAAPELAVMIEDPALWPEGYAPGRRPRPGPYRYRLRVRREATAPAGLYGADAVTDARTRPTGGDFARRRVTDQDFTVELTTPPSDGSALVFDLLSASSVLSLADRRRLLTAIGVSTPPADRVEEGPRGIRIAVSPLYTPRVGEAELEGAWLPVEMTLRYPAVGTTPETRRDAVRIPTEVFEHPLRIEPAPLLREDLAAETGRLLLLFPHPKAGVAGLLKGPSSIEDEAEAPPPLLRFRDPERRVGSLVRWNPRPGASDPVGAGRAASRLAPFFGGFNLFEVDAGAGAEGATTPPGAADLAYRFEVTTTGAPAKGKLRLGTTVAGPTLRLNTRDKDDVDQSALLDSLVALPEGRARLSLSTASTKLEFEIIGRSARTGERTLHLRALTPDGPAPQTGEAVRLVYRGPFQARPVARVQALPSTLAKLDPAEIADFSKIEARYPSDTVRQDPGSAGLKRSRIGRRSPWYSPAESLVVWPQQMLRRSLGGSVDERALTELLTAGRPMRVAVEVRIGTTDTRNVSLFEFIEGEQVQGQAGVFKRVDGAPWSVRSLRGLIRALVLTPDDKLKSLLADQDKSLNNAEVRLAGRKEDGTTLAEVSWPLDLNPYLHPVLSDVIDRARYDEAPSTALPKLGLGNAERAAAAPDAPDQMELQLTGWPDSAPARPKLVLARDGVIESDLRVQLRPGMDWKVVLEENLGNLSVVLSPEDRASLADHIERNPSDYDDVRLELYLGAETKAVQRWKLLLGSVIRPKGRSTAYRRYEPVIEPAPKSAAKDVIAWMDETPAQRDPYGWSVLRRVGLATGLRLFDTERNVYLEPRETLERLDAAFRAVLPRYAPEGSTIELGAPFVDLITRSGGAMSLADFDGGSAKLTPADRNKLLDEDALALTQISLRPVPRGLAAKGAGGPVAYALVTAEPGVEKVVLDLKSAPLSALVEICDLTTGLAAPSLITLASPAVPTDTGLKAAAERQRAEMAGTAGVASRYELVVPIKSDGRRPVALLRMTAVEGDADKLIACVESGGTATVIRGPLSGVDGDPEPFGRFPDMPAARVDALFAERETRVTNRVETVLRLAGHDEARAVAATFSRYARRAFPDNWPARPADVHGRLPEWTRRFLDHGHAAADAAVPHFAIAETVRPDPWRVGVSAADGRMEVLFTHEDRRRRLKRYLVEPFGRYETIAEALRQPQSDKSPAGEPRDYVTDPAVQGLVADWSRRFVDTVLPRTEPVAPPTLLSARRLTIDEAGKPKRVLEFLYARHNEEILSEANTTVEGALQFEGVSFGLWREFLHADWAAKLSADVDPLEQLPATPTKAPTLIEGDDKFGGLAQVRDGKQLVTGRAPDGWRGVTALRTATLPYFYRVHAVAYAAAGVVVSEPVVASIREGHYVLTKPWERALPGGGRTPEPSWQIERDADGVSVVLHVPLVRFVDGMPDEQRAAWLPASKPPPMAFMLPDPEVRWALRLVAEDASGAASVSPELEITADEAQGTYVVKCVGSRFTPTPAPKPIEKQGKATLSDPIWWRAAWEGNLPDAPYEAEPTFVPQVVLSGLGDFDLAPGAFTKGSGWPKVAPTCPAQLKVQVKPTTTPSWSSWRKAAAAWSDAMKKAGDGHPTSSAISSLLDGLAATTTDAETEAWWRAQGWVTAGGALKDGLVPIAAFPAGLPHLHDSGLPDEIGVRLLDGWTWPSPQDLRLADREDVRGLTAIVRTPSGLDFPADIVAPIVAEMRRLELVHKSRERGVQHTWSGADNAPRRCPPHTTALQGDLTATVAAVCRAAGIGGRIAPDTVDAIVRQPLKADDKDKLLALADALEAARFTAGALDDVAILLDALAAAGGAAVEGAVHLPAALRGDAAVMQALDDLGADLTAETPIALLLRMPPILAERRALMTAVRAALPDDDLRRRTIEFFEQAMADQAFGPGRRPVIRAEHGLEAPIEADVRVAGFAVPALQTEEA